jgi:hypothetical protein
MSRARNAKKAAAQVPAEKAPAFSGQPWMAVSKLC